MQASGTAPSTPKQLSIDDIPVKAQTPANQDSDLSSDGINYFGPAINTTNYDVEE